MELNIGFRADEKYVSTSLPLLKPWEIHEVLFDGVEYAQFDGKKDPTAKYEVLKIKFKNEKGQFQHTLFAPKPGDEKRTTRTNANGHESENPSNLEVFTKTIGHLLSEISPDTLTKLAGKSVNFEKLCKFLEAETKSKIGTPTCIKLIGDKDNKPRFPYMVSVFEKGGEAQVSDNCIGKNLSFTSYQLDKKREMENAKPTQMASSTTRGSEDALVSAPVQAAEKDPLDFDL